MLQAPHPLQDGHVPPPQPHPAVTLTLVNGQIQLNSNIAPGPQTWLVIAQMLHGGLSAVIQKLGQQDPVQEQPRIVIPSLQLGR